MPEMKRQAGPKKRPKVDYADPSTPLNFIDDDGINVLINPTNSDLKLRRQVARARERQQELNAAYDQRQKANAGNPTGKVHTGPKVDPSAITVTGMQNLNNLYKNFDVDADEAAEFERNNQMPSTEVRPEPATPENLPAVISRMMTAKNPNAARNGDVEPRFFMVKDLPGYLAAPIRQLGKSIFSAFTTLPLDKISVCANLGGQGPCTSHELNVMTGWLKRNAVKRDSMKMDFSQVMPGYSADVLLYDAEDFSFLVVKDDIGSYIYSWPQKNAISLSQAQRKLLGESSNITTFHYWTKLLLG